MTTNTSQFQSPALITSRKFPQNPVELEPTLSKMYLDIATIVNLKTTGIYEKLQLVTGDSYYNNSSPVNPSQRRQGYRQLFTFGAIAAGASTTIPFDMTQITETVQIYGNCITDSTASKFRSIPWTSATDVTQQIQFDMDTSTNPNTIKITNGAGAPNILSGTIIVEYLLN